MPTKAELEEKIAGLEEELARLNGESVEGTEGVPPEPPRYNIQIGVKRNDYNYGFVEVNFGASGVTDENKDIVIDEANDIFEALFLKFVQKVEASVEGGKFNYEESREIPSNVIPWDSSNPPVRVEGSITSSTPPFVPDEVPDVPPWLKTEPDATPAVEDGDDYDEDDETVVSFDLPSWAQPVANLDGDDFSL